MHGHEEDFLKQLRFRIVCHRGISLAVLIPNVNLKDTLLLLLLFLTLCNIY